MKLKKHQIVLDDGAEIDAQSPIVISASRATDISIFYSYFFITRWKVGYIKCTGYIK